MAINLRNYNQDLLASLASFSEGMQKMQTTKAIRDANTKVDEIKNSELKAAEKEAQIRKVGTDLAGMFATNNVHPQQAELVLSQLIPQPSAVEMQAKYAVALEDMKQKNRIELQKVKQEGSSGKVDARQADNRFKLIKRFEDKNKSILDDISNLGQIKTMIATDTTAGLELSKLKLVKMAQGAGVVTDRDVAKAEADPSYSARLVRNVSKNILGSPIEDDKEMFVDLANKLAMAGRQRLTGEASRFSKQHHKFAGMEADMFEQDLMLSIPSLDESVAQGSGPSWLKSAGVDAGQTMNAAASPAAGQPSWLKSAPASSVEPPSDIDQFLSQEAQKSKRRRLGGL